MVLKDRKLYTGVGISVEWGWPQPVLLDRWGASHIVPICRWYIYYRRWEANWRLQVQPCSGIWDETPWVDALLSGIGGLVERSMFLHQVCRLHRALYRLMQAPRAWYSRIANYLWEMGFQCSEADHILYFLTSEVPLILILYVDDLFFTGDERLIDNC